MVGMRNYGHQTPNATTLQHGIKAIMHLPSLTSLLLSTVLLLNLTNALPLPNLYKRLVINEEHNLIGSTKANFPSQNPVQNLGGTAYRGFRYSNGVDGYRGYNEGSFN